MSHRSHNLYEKNAQSTMVLGITMLP